jgi:hypothetical protein
MRLSQNFLKNCEKANSGIDTGTYVIPDITPDMQLMIPDESTASTNDISSASLPALPTKVLPADSNLVFSPISENIPEEVPYNLEERVPGFQVSHCELCLAVDRECKALYERKIESEKQLIKLNQQLEKERRLREACEKGKELIDIEIEDITAELFARANQMVVDEAYKLQAVQQQNRELNRQNRKMSIILKDKEKELGEAMKLLYKLEKQMGMESHHVPVSKSTDQLDTQKVAVMDFAHSIISGFDNYNASVAGDGVIFSEFQEFVQIIFKSSQQLSNVAFHSVHNSAFMKRVMYESVEPCLYYAYHRNSFNSGMGQWLKKRLFESCTKGHVNISQAPIDTKNMAQKSKCLLCMLQRECEYKISLGPDVKLETTSVCRFCRDRVLAVQDFFEFVTCLCTNTTIQTATILSTFKKVLWLRRRMAVAVLGSCSLFETEITAMMGPGSSGDWEQFVDIKH